MKPSVQYNDRIGHASADIAGIDYGAIARLCNLGSRYTIIGISLYGIRKIDVSLLCRDNEESTPEKEVLVHVFPNIDLPVSSVLERLNVRINITTDRKYDDPELKTVREVSLDNDNDEENDEENDIII
jgi:vacuolar-type H+-ATPase subunit F/Vma7